MVGLEAGMQRASECEVSELNVDTLGWTWGNDNLPSWLFGNISPQFHLWRTRVQTEQNHNDSDGGKIMGLATAKGHWTQQAINQNDTCEDLVAWTGEEGRWHRSLGTFQEVRGKILCRSTGSGEWKVWIRYAHKHLNRKEGRCEVKLDRIRHPDLGQACRPCLSWWR